MRLAPDDVTTMVCGFCATGCGLNVHLRDGRAINHGQRLRARAEELDEFSDHLGLAQHLRDGERQVGRGDALAERAGQMNADHVRGQEIHGLA